MKSKRFFAEFLKPLVGLGLDDIEKLIELPPDSQMGDLAFPCFSLSKQLKKSPAIIANELSQIKITVSFIKEIRAIGPYLNCFLNAEQMAEVVLTQILMEGEMYPISKVGENKTIVIDFSSPNIAKPLGIHHIRTTMIGNSLANLCKQMGYKVVRLNYLGDWGTQFGKLIVAYLRWGNEIKEFTVAEINNLYVKFSKLAKEDETLDNEARNWFRKLENGDEEALSFWKIFRDVSIKELARIYERIGVKFDEYSGESFHGKTILKVLEEVKQKDLAVLSDGALVVESDEENEPPCLLLKSDGATTYQLRDIAAMQDRFEKYKFSKMFYVVAQDQALHLKQVFDVSRKLGREYASACEHIPFGLLLFKEGKFSTREGNIILLEDVIDTAIEKVKGIIDDRGANSVVSDASIFKIAWGAIVFADLSTKRTKNVEFIWEEILNFDGDTGPYLQYSVARCRSIIRKSNVEFKTIDWKLLKSDYEKALIIKLDLFNDTVSLATENKEPSILANYLLTLAKTSNKMIHSGKEDFNMRVLQEEHKELQIARTALLQATANILTNGLRLLGMEAPDFM